MTIKNTGLEAFILRNSKMMATSLVFKMSGGGVINRANSAKQKQKSATRLVNYLTGAGRKVSQIIRQSIA